MLKYRIISFDGGGIRGALSAKLLQRLAIHWPQLVNKVDLLAGTSTGSFIALGLAHGLSPTELVNIYSNENGKKIFTPEHNELLRPRYDNKNLRDVLAKIFPEDLQLKDLKKHVVVPAFCLNPSNSGDWSPIFFHNFPDSQYLTMPVLDVALASSAAPVYFPAFNNYIDGGVMANNPGTAALALAHENRPGRKTLRKVVLLSISTGYNPNKITADTTKWGILEWTLYPQPSVPLLTVLFDSIVEADTFYCQNLLGKRYYRLNPQLSKPVYLDDYKQISYLLSIAENYDLRPVLRWISSTWL